MTGILTEYTTLYRHCRGTFRYRYVFAAYIPLRGRFAGIHPGLNMFGPLGGIEILVLLILGLLVFGPRRLPQIGRSIGRVLFELRKAATELKTSIEKEIDLEEVKKATQSIQREVNENLIGGIKRDLEELDPRKDVEALTDPLDRGKGGSGQD